MNVRRGLLPYLVLGAALCLVSGCAMHGGESAGPGSNLLVNPGFEGEAENGEVRLWQHGEAAPGSAGSSFGVYAGSDGGGVALGIGGGWDGQGFWTTALPACESGATYRFTAEVLQRGMGNGAYAEIELWGRRFRLNTVVDEGRFIFSPQEIVCPQRVDGAGEFRFLHPGGQGAVYLRRPALVRKAAQPKPPEPPRPAFFPLGVYGAHADNLGDIAAMGFNSAIIGPDPALLAQCRRLGLRCMVNVPRDPAPLARLLDSSSAPLDGPDLSFYVNDEPGINGYPPDRAEAIQALLRARYPRAFTAMAVVRPQVIPWFAEAADFFMLDQYPVPSMPLAWLADSIDEAAGYVGRDRLMAVIQAFGGDAYAVYGWPRLPGLEEINALTFLALIHGVRGLYFFIFDDMTAVPEGRAALAEVVGRLNRLGTWLETPNSGQPVAVEMVSIHATGNRGEPAVHCVLKEREGSRLLLCANSTGTFVRAAIRPADGAGEWLGVEDGVEYMFPKQGLEMEFSPFETMVLLGKGAD